MSALPIPSKESQKYSQQLCDLVQIKIKQSGGWLPFSDFMHMALYTPETGYYTGGLKKIADTQSGGGDFVTAPEISPLFAQALAAQMAEMLELTGGNILELGAGTGKMAAGILQALAKQGCLPTHYYILEVSNHLRKVQSETIDAILPKSINERVVWLDVLPLEHTGVIVGNELLDALPVHLLTKKAGQMFERGVRFNGQFAWFDQPLQDQRLLDLINANAWPDGYLSEVCPAAVGLMRSLVDSLKHGFILMIDYGFGAKEYYHPQRNQGTLMCHYQHYAHSNPLTYIGLQDITAHVNFTAIAEAATQKGLVLEGYTNQAQFLMNCGLLDLLNQQAVDQSAKYPQLAAGVQKLLSPAEMGDLFKVIAFSRGIKETLSGFANGDKSHTL